MIKEIEVKAKIKNPAEILKKLADLGCVLSSPIVQNDQIFLPIGKTLDQKISGTSVVRIRQADNKIFLTLKQSRQNELDCLEKELEINNAEVMKEILEMMGFYLIVKINKTRIKCRYRDYEVCVDKVEGLGDFVEVEKMSANDGPAVQAELFAFLETLGISKNDQVMQGYDTLCFKRKY